MNIIHIQIHWALYSYSYMCRYLNMSVSVRRFDGSRWIWARQQTGDRVRDGVKNIDLNLLPYSLRAPVWKTIRISHPDSRTGRCTAVCLQCLKEKNSTQAYFKWALVDSKPRNSSNANNHMERHHPEIHAKNTVLTKDSNIYTNKHRGAIRSFLVKKMPPLEKAVSDACFIKFLVDCPNTPSSIASNLSLSQ